MAFVYWIKLDTHTDILSEGYVGITTKTVKRRYLAHLRDSIKPTSFKGRCVVHSAISKYKERIQVITVCECSKEYASYLENKLRPREQIGWNIAIGGEYMSMLGRSQTEHQKSVVRELQSGVIRDPDLICKIAEINKTRLRSEDEIRKRSEAISSKHLLDLHSTNLDVLSRVNDIYLCFKDGLGQRLIAKNLDIPIRGMTALFNKFNAGYNPTQDQRMQDFVVSYQGKYGVYVTGNETEEVVEPSGIVCKGVFKDLRGNFVAYLTVNGKRHCKTFNKTRLGEDVARDAAMTYRKYLEETLLEYSTSKTQTN